MVYIYKVCVLKLWSAQKILHFSKIIRRVASNVDLKAGQVLVKKRAEQLFLEDVCAFAHRMEGGQDDQLLFLVGSFEKAFVCLRADLVTDRDSRMLMADDDRRYPWRQEAGDLVAVKKKDVAQDGLILDSEVPLSGDGAENGVVIAADQDDLFRVSKKEVEKLQRLSPFLLGNHAELVLDVADEDHFFRARLFQDALHPAHDLSKMEPGNHDALLVQRLFDADVDVADDDSGADLKNKVDDADAGKEFYLV